MKKYMVSARVTISLHKKIEATSPKEAMKIARGLGMPGLCYSCSNGGSQDEESWELSGELDGEPVEIAIED
jgi:hypothetical protein